jgi:hypothetical protein
LIFSLQVKRIKIEKKGAAHRNICRKQLVYSFLGAAHRDVKPLNGRGALHYISFSFIFLQISRNAVAKNLMRLP